MREEGRILSVDEKAVTVMVLSDGVRAQMGSEELRDTKEPMQTSDHR